jgi:serine/threonine protein kinase
MELGLSPGLPLNGRRERAAQFGLSDQSVEAFELNQSFPFANRPTNKANTHSPEINYIAREFNTNGFELNAVSFLKKNLTKNKFQNLTSLLNETQYNNTSYFNANNNNVTNNNQSCLSPTMPSHQAQSKFDKSWAFFNHLNNNETADSELVAITNMNKALVVINGRTTEILTANDLSSTLFGYQTEEKLIGMRLRDLIDTQNDEYDKLIECDRLDQSGRVVMCSGKIFDAVRVDESTNERSTVPISLYMLKLTDEPEPKCLCVMEQVQRVSGTFSVNLKGRIRKYNAKFAYIFGYSNTTNALMPQANTPSSLSSLSASSVLNDKDINQLVPCMKLPCMGSITPEVRKQSLTGRTFQGENIPLVVNMLSKQLINNEEIVYNCSVSVYTNLSGLFTVRLSDYQINSYNSTFSRLLLGYDERQLLNKPITQLIGNFFEPDLSSTTVATGGRPTPMNNSYLSGSMHRHSHLANKSLSANQHNKSQLNQSTKAHQLTHNGSYLETSSTTTTTTTTTCTATVQQGTKLLTPVKQEQPTVIPSFSIVNVDEVNKKLENEQHQQVGKDDQNCANKRKSFSKKSSSESNDLLNEFNLHSADYSPNQKCANFIESSNFNQSMPNTPQSTVKKSLLAKAITNNATLSAVEQRVSLGAESPMENEMQQSECISPTSDAMSISATNSPSTQSQRASSSFKRSALFEVSQFEDDEESMDEQGEDKAEVESIQFVDEETTTNMGKNSNVNKNQLVGLINNQAKEPRGEQDASEVSLIATDNDDDHNSDFNDFEEEDYNTTAADHQTNKRKISNVIGESETSHKKNVSFSNDANKKFKNQVTSTPSNLTNITNKSSYARASADRSMKLNRSSLGYLNTNDGFFFGRARHHDGSLIRIIYQRKQVKLSDNQNVICVWISRDPYTDKSMIDCSQLVESQQQHTKLNQTLGNGECGNYYNEYEDVLTLGRGASGFVQLARRKVDRFEVVTKYILKSKIYKENWINEERYGNIPLEVSILCKLDHANIIKVLEVFQDNDYVHMVMEKHGCGMDLFEFIDRQRRHIEEPLASYIFRQLVSAVSYLHSNMIVHRDIKDENIVINEQFHVKLIDFGSAAYITKGKKFATFCGTMDYCSPDVLLGNKYYGPELDAWTCGIALYTLVFCENPFFNAEETIECILNPPFKVSKDLMKLLLSILCAKPELRATIEEIEANAWVNQPCDISKYKWEEVLRNSEFLANNAGNIDEEYGVAHIKERFKLENQPSEEQHELDTDNQKENVNNLKPEQSNMCSYKNEPHLQPQQYATLSRSF